MAAKVTYLGIFLLIFFNPAPGLADTKKYTSLQYFKNYALSTCVADGFQSEEVVKDAAAAARGYLELGDLPLEAHTEATLLGRKFLAREYKSISGGKLTLMKCLDFYHSKELDQLSKKYLGRK